MEAIKYYVKGAFQGVAETPAVLEQQEELVSDLEAKVADLVAEGRTKEEALGLAIASVGDLGMLVREFETAPDVEPEPLTAEVYAWKLELHTAAITSLPILGTLFLFLLALAFAGSLRAAIPMLFFAAALTALGWIGWALYRFHRGPDELQTIALSQKGEMRSALTVWASACAFAFMLNFVASTTGFWAWFAWVGLAAWPLRAIVYRRLVSAGKFVHTPVPAEVSHSARTVACA